MRAGYLLPVAYVACFSMFRSTEESGPLALMKNDGSDGRTALAALSGLNIWPVMKRRYLAFGPPVPEMAQHNDNGDCEVCKQHLEGESRP